MTKKRILFVTPIYLPASLPGSVVFVQELAERLTKDGHDITILTVETADAQFWYKPMFLKNRLKHGELINGVKVVRLPVSSLFSSFFYLVHKVTGRFLTSKIRDYVELMKTGPRFKGIETFLSLVPQFDSIHISTLPMGYNLQVLNTLEKINYHSNVVITPFYHKGVDGFSNSLIEHILQKVDKIHVLTQSEHNELSSTFHISSEKFERIPLFVDLSKFSLQNEVEEIARELVKEYGLEGKKVILFAGNKGKLKGAINTLNSLHEIYKEDKEIRFIAIGNSTPAWDEAKVSIDSRFLIDLGYQKGITKEAIFFLCDIYCMPSLSESFGIVYLEAWHKKKPLITANVSSVCEITSGGAIHVEFNNNEELKKAIKSLLNDAQLHNKLGNIGFEKLMSSYTLDAVISKYAKLL